MKIKTELVDQNSRCSVSTEWCKKAKIQDHNTCTKARFALCGVRFESACSIFVNTCALWEQGGRNAIRDEFARPSHSSQHCPLIRNVLDDNGLYNTGFLFSTDFWVWVRISIDSFLFIAFSSFVLHTDYLWNRMLPGKFLSWCELPIFKNNTSNWITNIRSHNFGQDKRLSLSHLICIWHKKNPKTVLSMFFFLGKF